MIVDLSGYSFTGKSAVYDLLLEFEGVASFGKEFEFDLVRMPGGILDLDTALTQNWSPVRSSESIRRFRKIIRNLGGNKGMLSRLTRLGSHYDFHFSKFSECSSEYLDSLICNSWASPWPFAYYDSNPVSVILRKTLRRLALSDIFTAEVYLARMDEAEFVEKTKLYFKKMFASNDHLQSKYILLNNAFEPFFPERSMRYFEDSRAIVVDRDPRDVYLSALRNGKAGGALVGTAVLGNSVEDFISRYRIYRQSGSTANDRVLRLNFESLVCKYEETLSEIVEFLELNPSAHKCKGENFDPSASAAGLRQWRGASESESRAIRVIERELSEFCLS